MDFVRLPEGVAWTSPPLFTVTCERSAVEARFGPSTLFDLDSNGLGSFDAWTLRFACGLEVSLWSLERLPDMVEVHANERDAGHILHHLALRGRVDRCVPDPCLAGEPQFIVMRLDDNGGQYEVLRTTSACEAAQVQHDYEARGHRQAYWVERVQAATARVRPRSG